MASSVERTEDDGAWSEFPVSAGVAGDPPVLAVEVSRT
jgi:hypothetical protein